MKNIKFIYLIIILAFSFQSCQDYFGDVNENPNSPSKVPPRTLLPSIESILTYGLWGDISRYNSLLTRQVDGVDRQFAAYQQYIIRGNDMDNIWGSILYSNVLTDIAALRDASGDPNTNGAYHGIANILEAYTFLVLTDHFGDIPFSEAVNKKNDGNLQPKFDTQETVYNECIKLLNEGIILLDGPSSLKPGNDDFIYKGDLNKWKKFGHGILARAYLHLSKRDPANIQRALNSANLSLTSNNENPGFEWEASKANPWYQFNDQRQGSFNVGSFYFELMENLGDPRISKFGASLDNNHPILRPTASLPLMSYDEIAFIIAETSFRLNIQGVDTLFRNAIKSSFERHNIGGFETYFAKPEVSALTLENIITQKYIALFLDPETFSDWRRTGFPQLEPNTGTAIPRRYPYPQTETDYNVNCPKPDQVGLFDRIWWDIN